MFSEVSVFEAFTLLRRGTQRAIDNYPAVVDEFVILMPDFLPVVWTGSAWELVSGHLLYTQLMDDLVGYYDSRTFLHRTELMLHFPHVYGTTEAIDKRVLPAGAVVCNTDTETVHIGDGETAGGVVVPA